MMYDVCVGVVIEEEEALHVVPGLREKVAMYKSDEWRFGGRAGTKPFRYSLQKKFAFGLMDVNMASERNGVAESVDVYSDTLSLALVPLLEGVLHGVRVTPADITARIDEAATVIEKVAAEGGLRAHLQGLVDTSSNGRVVGPVADEEGQALAQHMREVAAWLASEL